MEGANDVLRRQNHGLTHARRHPKSGQTPLLPILGTAGPKGQSLPIYVAMELSASQS